MCVHISHLAMYVELGRPRVDVDNTHPGWYMDMCMYIYIYLCIHVHVYMCMYMCVYTCVYMYIYIYM